MLRIAIVVKGGLVQEIVVPERLEGPVEAAVVDLDVEGALEEDLVRYDGNDADIRAGQVVRCDQLVEEAFEQRN